MGESGQSRGYHGLAYGRSGVSPEELGHPSAKSLGGVVGLLNRDTIAVAGVTQPVWVVPPFVKASAESVRFEQ